MWKAGTVPLGLAWVWAPAAHVALTLTGIELGLCQWELGMGGKPRDGAWQDGD